MSKRREPAPRVVWMVLAEDGEHMFAGCSREIAETNLSHEQDATGDLSLRSVRYVRGNLLDKALRELNGARNALHGLGECSLAADIGLVHDRIRKLVGEG